MSNKKTLKWKISMITIIILIIIMTSVSYVIYNYTARIVKEEVKKQINIMNIYQKKIIDDMIGGLRSQTQFFTQDYAIQGFLEMCQKYYTEFKLAEDEKTREQAWTDFNALLDSMTYSTGKRIFEKLDNVGYSRFAYLVMPEGIIVADSRMKYRKDREKFTDYIKLKLKEEQYKDLKFGTLQYVNKIPYLVYSAPVFTDEAIKEPIGYIVIGLAVNIITDSLETMIGDFGSVILTNENGIILNHGNYNLVGTAIKNEWFLEQIKSGVRFKDIVTDGIYNILNKIKGEELYLAATISNYNIITPASKLKNIIWLITLVGMIIMFVIMFIVLSWQFRPLKELLKKISMVREGNLETQIDVNTDDEIGELADDFNKMVADIKQLLKTVKDDQQQLREYELKALQAQINPHFLYNTLDSIYWMTKTREYDEIGDITVALSQFFRLSFNNGKDFTTVEKEIIHVSNYLLVQQLRYPDKFNWDIDVDKDIYNNECIKLILQPLVENSLAHGLKHKKKDGYIKVTGVKEKGIVSLQVEDNGCGINVEELENNLKNDEVTDTGYALRNVNRRIELYYGKPFGLYFSNTGLGACVEIRLPVKPMIIKDENNVLGEEEDV